MSNITREKIQSISTFPALVKFLKEDLGWNLQSDEIDDLSFDYEPEDLGIDSKSAVKIKEIKQLRPFTSNQPWGIFYIRFEPKKLPVVVFRRILRNLVFKKRASANTPDGVF